MLRITLGIHAKEKAAERGIPANAVLAILNGGSTVAIPSKRDPEAVIVLRKYAKKVWAIVLNHETLNVITARRASKKERRFYEQEIKD